MQKQERPYMWAVVIAALLTVIPPHHLLARPSEGTTTVLSQNADPGNVPLADSNLNIPTTGALNDRSHGRLKIGLAATSHSLTFAFLETRKVATFAVDAFFGRFLGKESFRHDR